ncbi:hypothetical protein AB0P45_10200 [Streptomyces niveus]|uniref:hypothetical protein n=1 Tax=Streptomyces niveus TaxID=193462 RepID=UPI00343E8CAC
MPLLARSAFTVTSAVVVLLAPAAHAVPVAAAPAATPTPKIVASGWSGDHGVASATCPAGTGLSTGGFDSQNTRNGYGQNTDGVEENAPSPTKANTWLVQMARGKAKAFALCVPGAPTPSIVASGWVDDGGTARATCPAGMAMIGGGADSKAYKNGYGNVTDTQQINAPDDKKANTWMAQMMIGSSRALVMCTK